MIATPLSLIVIAASVVLAAPSLTTSGCDISNAELSLPPGLPPPTSPPSYISVAIGVQNYTCADTGAYTYASLPKPRRTYCSSECTRRLTPTILGQHYFITNPITGSGLSPKWDFTSQGATKGNPDAFVVGARSGGVPAPTGPQDIDWLFLTGVQGQLADQIYRVDTRGGQPPATCTPGSAPISVKYASKYCKFLSTRNLTAL
ncbi:hypothetical protein PLEOSDRAFT_1034910 [Pleurotus ostreatus PC15]|uniref:Uncharacterized protein n=1 Tax=Pleurotus ostreatus (strain PC15) TaxID=1137138 RepID=A0A067P661_PLEO1|nr:hypothetical protein PLEOSDRAFT_1034910 [Pleurotus ostreatus PC15]